MSIALNEVASFMALIRGIIESFCRACPQIGSFFISFFVVLCTMACFKAISYKQGEHGE